MNQSLQDKKTWLSDMVSADMDSEAMVRGFLKFYVMEGGCLADVQKDVRRLAPWEESRAAMVTLMLQGAIEDMLEAPERSEMRTIDEVKAIVAAVRAGEKVRIEYYDPEDDCEMVSGA